MTNRVVIIGRITRNLELKKVKSGKSLTNFSIAVNPRKGEAYYFDCVAWGTVAENICKYLQKGSQIAIDGQLVSNTYQNKSGNNVTKISISVNSAEFLGGNESKKKVTSESEYEEAETDEEEELPF